MRQGQLCNPSIFYEETWQVTLLHSIEAREALKVMLMFFQVLDDLTCLSTISQSKLSQSRSTDYELQTYKYKCMPDIRSICYT